MTRLLKITALLFGLNLLILSLGGTALRPNDPNERVPVLENASTTGRPQPVQIWPGVERPLALMPDGAADLQLRGIHPDGTIVYFSKLGVDYTLTDLVKISGTPPRIQTVEKNILAGSLIAPYDLLTDPADQTWLLYALPTADGGWGYWLTHLTTGRRYNISAALGSRQVMYGGTGLLTQDNRWLLVTTYDGTKMDIVRFDLQDNTWINLTAAYDIPTSNLIWTQIGDWIVVEVDSRVYRLSLDGAVYEPLLGEGSEIYEVLLSWDEASGVVAMEQNGLRYGIEVATRRVVWQYDELRFGFIQPNVDGWVLATYDRLPVRLNISTGEIQSVPDTLDPVLDVPVFLTDDRTVYAQNDPTGMGYSLWGSFDWDTGEFHLTQQSMVDFWFLALSPDNDWMWLNGPDGLYRMRLEDGHLEYLTDGWPYFLVGWMKPPVHAWHPTPLILINLALIVIGVIPRDLFQLHHRKPPLVETT